MFNAFSSIFTSNVTAVGDNLEDLNTIKSVLSQFAKTQNINHIVVSNPHNRASEPIDEPGVLHIRFWSCPGSSSQRRVISSAFGTRLASNQEDAVQYSGIGQEIVDDYGLIIGEYLPGTLYIHFDLPHGDNVEYLLTRLLESFTVFNSNDPEKIQKMQAEIFARAEQRFVALCQNLTGFQKESIIEEIKTNDDYLREAQEEIVNHTRRRKDLQNRLKIIYEIEKNGDTTSFKDQFSELSKISVTGKIQVSGKSIIVPVGQVDILHEDVLYDIGVFNVVINTDGQEDAVLCINNTRKAVDGALYHPHVKSDGSCCLGSISEVITDLVSKGDYVSTVLIMTDFLGSYNEGSAYAKLNNFPTKRTG